VKDARHSDCQSDLAFVFKVVDPCPAFFQSLIQVKIAYYGRFFRMIKSIKLFLVDLSPSPFKVTNNDTSYRIKIF
jgi:hypothetical protein